jgi:hypothetical protein
LHGAGEVTRVSGDQVLSWNVERGENSTDRRLVVQLNQAQKDSFALQVQLQTPLGAFPQTTDAMRLQPEGATRFAGYFRIVNEGAVAESRKRAGCRRFRPNNFPRAMPPKPCCARRAVSALLIAFPARIIPCACRRIKFSGGRFRNALVSSRSERTRLKRNRTRCAQAVA